MFANGGARHAIDTWSATALADLSFECDAAATFSGRLHSQLALTGERWRMTSPQVGTKDMLKLEARKLTVVSGNAGWGDALVADEPMAPGAIFLRVPTDSIVDVPTYQSVQIDETKHVMARGTLAAINHSCRPNMLIDTSRLVCQVIRPIAAGDALTYFYPSTEWNMAQPFVCVCGAPNCIRIVAGARHLSVDTLSRYFLNAHILSLM